MFYHSIPKFVLYLNHSLIWQLRRAICHFSHKSLVTIDHIVFSVFRLELACNWGSFWWYFPYEPLLQASSSPLPTIRIWSIKQNIIYAWAVHYKETLICRSLCGLPAWMKLRKKNCIEWLELSLFSFRHQYTNLCSK